MRTLSLRRTTAADPSAAIQRLPRCAEMLWSARCVSSSLNQDDERLHFALLLSRPRPFSTGNYAPRPPRPQARRASPNARRRAACTVGRVSDSERKRPTAASVDTELEFSYLAHRRQPGMYVPPTEVAPSDTPSTAGRPARRIPNAPRISRMLPSSLGRVGLPRLLLVPLHVVLVQLGRPRPVVHLPHHPACTPRPPGGQVLTTGGAARPNR